MLKPVFGFLGKFIARVSGVPAMDFEDGEVDQLAEGFAPVMERYAPGVFANHQELVAFGLVLSGVAGTRVMIYQMAVAARKKELAARQAVAPRPQA
jgi:hypothetical protein